jgi:outer membrane PBP1 activator LpoA protein
MQPMPLISRFLLIASLATLLTACTGGLGRLGELGGLAGLVKKAQDPDVLRAENYLQQKDYLAAATLYRALATRDKTQSNHYLLLAADASLQGGDLQTAEASLQQINGQTLDIQQKLHYQVLQAEPALSKKQSQQALDSLLAITPNAQHKPGLRERYYRALAQAYRQLGNLLESAHSLQSLDELLQDPQQRLKIQGEILRNLSALNELALTHQQPSPPAVKGGWMQLALLVKQHSNNPAALQNAYQAWHQRFPEHPALPELLTLYIGQLEEQLQHATRIAVLLPLTGPYASVARAVQDGLLVSLYRIPTEQRPSLLFYDSNDNNAIWPIYSQAVEDGADFVIGPLQKSAVSQLARAGQLRLPVLALNQVNLDNAPADNFYMFGLLPEDEARQAAERMWSDGVRKPVTFLPRNKWGERLFQAFNERWLTLTGNNVEMRHYDPKDYDHSASILDLLNLDQSKARHTELQRWLGTRLEFEPRRRHDIDGIFLIARNWQAQSFPSQLRFHMASNLPIYTTSHVWNGQLSQQQLADMRDMLLPDIPMFTTNDTRKTLAPTIPGITGKLGRLYALGMDALALTSHLKRLQSDPFQSMEGETGNLYMDSENRLHRQLVWLQLGSPHKILGYTTHPDLPDVAKETNTMN